MHEIRWARRVRPEQTDLTVVEIKETEDGRGGHWDVGCTLCPVNLQRIKCDRAVASA